MTAPERRPTSEPEVVGELERGRLCIALATYTSLLLVLAAGIETFDFLIPCVGLALLVAFALVHQGNRGARALLVVGYASGGLSAAFFAYGGYALQHATGLYLPLSAAGCALNAVLLARPSVGAFMRQKRLLLLLPPSVAEPTDDRDDDRDNDRDDDRDNDDD